MKTYVTILFGLFVIWTGFLRCIEAQAFKPNAFWFCLVMGLIAVGAGFLYRMDREKTAAVVAILAGAIVMAFYLYCLIKQPEKDANYRVAMVIVASIAQLVFILLPARDRDRPM